MAWEREIEVCRDVARRAGELALRHAARGVEREDKAAEGRTTNYVMLRLDALFDRPVVTFEHLARPPFSRYRWAVRQSGTRVPGSLANALEALWEPQREAAMATLRKRRT